VASANKAKPAHSAFYGKEVGYIHHLQTFREHSIVHDTNQIKNLLDNCGETCTFLGYADDHAGNMYQMFNPMTKHIWTT